MTIQQIAFHHHSPNRPQIDMRPELPVRPWLAVAFVLSLMLLFF